MSLRLHEVSLVACLIAITISASDTVVCVDSVTVGNSIYVTVYNGLDGSVDNINTFRFSCLVRVYHTSILSMSFYVIYIDILLFLLKMQRIVHMRPLLDA